MSLLLSEDVYVMIPPVMTMTPLRLSEDTKMMKMIRYVALLQLFGGDLRDVPSLSMPLLKQ
jgi:hypothetical protein